MKKITIFTPIFNRGYILERLYKSLIDQTNKNFIWLIVNDGSTDNTEDIVENWILEQEIEINYYKQENGGKQRAHNAGVNACKTELFFCVDSDDYLIQNAVDEIIRIWKNVVTKENISGIVALRGSSDLNPVKSFFPSDIKYSTLDALYNKYNFKGDTALIYRTDLLKKYPFKVAKREKFIGENFVYIQIDQNNELILFNKVIYICEYLPDGYTKNVRRLTKENPRGYMELQKMELIYAKTFKKKFLLSIKYIVGCLLAKEKSLIKDAPYKVLAIIAYFPAVIYVRKNYSGESK